MQKKIKKTVMLFCSKFFVERMFSGLHSNNMEYCQCFKAFVPSLLQSQKKIICLLLFGFHCKVILFLSSNTYLYLHTNKGFMCFKQKRPYLSQMSDML